MLLTTAAAAATLWVGGCASGGVTIAAECDPPASAEPATFGAFDTLPRARVGCLPFPGMFTLYSSASPDALGEHCYEDPNGEISRGIVYTERGGFLDVAHVRNAADMTAYLHARVSHAMHAGWDCLQFQGHEPCRYTVRLDYPDFWDDLPDAERHALIEEASVRLAQRLALQVMTWHEILTWYGYKSTGFVSESGSAFTYEDGPSHAVGVLIAGDALRHPGDFAAQVTALLDQTLADLGVVDSDTLKAAIRAVEGDWWSGGKVVRRHLETGFEENTVTPWLVPGLPGLESAEPVTWEVPTLDDVNGHDCASMYRVTIEPRVNEAGKILARLPDAHGTVEPYRDFPLLIADIEAEIGPEFARIDAPERPKTAARDR